MARSEEKTAEKRGFSIPEPLQIKERFLHSCTWGPWLCKNIMKDLDEDMEMHVSSKLTLNYNTEHNYVTSEQM